jgi:hypothetical protein
MPIYPSWLRVCEQEIEEHQLVRAPAVSAILPTVPASVLKKRAEGPQNHEFLSLFTWCLVARSNATYSGISIAFFIPRKLTKSRQT